MLWYKITPVRPTVRGVATAVVAVGVCGCPRGHALLRGETVVYTGRQEVSARRVVARVRAAGRRARLCRGAIVASVALAAALVVPAPAAWAQTEITDQPEQQPERELTAAERAAEAAEKALELGAVEEFEPVTFEEMLRDPDNIELNFRFARTQIRNGNLRGAAATLERILLLNPDLAQVRLAYAVVLFRLDNLDEAEREFKIVAAVDIPADVRAEVDGYLERIALRRRVTRYTVSLSLGAHYDTNRTATPRSNSELAFDNRISVGDEQDDVGYLGIGRIRVDHDLGFQERHEVFGALTYFHDEQTTEDTFDLQAFILEAGGIYRGAFLDHDTIPSFDIIPSVFVTHLRLSRANFFKEYGFDVRLARRFGPRISGGVGVRLSDQTFRTISESRVSTLRDGRRIEGILSATFIINPRMRIAGEYLHFDKNAKADFFAYDRDQFRLNHSWALGEGQFLLTELSYQRDRYNGPDVSISARTRHDDIYRARVTYGAPLMFFFGRGTLWRPLEDVTLSGSTEYLRSSSNILDFDYENWKVQALLTKRWRF